MNYGNNRKLIVGERVWVRDGVTTGLFEVTKTENPFGGNHPDTVWVRSLTTSVCPNQSHLRWNCYAESDEMELLLACLADDIDFMQRDLKKLTESKDEQDAENA